MPLSYRQFAIWILSDLAIRKAEPDRITFTGNRVCSQHLLPTRLEKETATQFAIRLQEFRKGLPRYSDASERLALAVKAFMLDGEKSFAAAQSVLRILGKMPAEKRAEYERQGIGYAFRPIEMLIGRTRRNRRTRKKKHDKTPEESQADTIRAQASRFIHNRKDFEALFQRRLGSFRYECCRDAEWVTPWRRHTPPAWRHLRRFLGRLIGSEQCR
jgi:T5orf172 domain